MNRCRGGRMAISKLLNDLLFLYHNIKQVKEKDSILSARIQVEAMAE